MKILMHAISNVHVGCGFSTPDVEYWFPCHKAK